jgi:hypothetical protein
MEKNSSLKKYNRIHKTELKRDNESKKNIYNELLKINKMALTSNMDIPLNSIKNLADLENFASLISKNTFNMRKYKRNNVRKLLYGDKRFKNSRGLLHNNQDIYNTFKLCIEYKLEKDYTKLDDSDLISKLKNIFNKLINYNNINEEINKASIKYKNEGLTRNEIINLLNKHYTTTNYITLNKDNIKVLNNFLHKKIVNLDMEINDSYKESIEILYNKYEKLEVHYIGISQKINNKKEGSFFAYYNLSNIDLKKYQIYKKNEFINTENCLIYSLMQFELDPLIINNIKLLCKCNYITLKTLKLIAEKFNLFINLYEPTKKKLYKYGNKNNKLIKLLLYKNHYMCNDKLEYNQKKTSILRVIMDLFKKNKFEPINEFYINKLKNNKQNDIQINSLEYLDNDIRKCERDEPKLNKYNKNNVYYADYETFTNEEIHIPYLLCCYNLNTNQYKIYLKNEEKKISLFEELIKQLPNNSYVYFHNLTYDASMLLNNLVFGNVINSCVHNNKIMSLTILYGKKTIFIRDSYCLISKPLRSFPKMFNLNIIKEIYAYTFYNNNILKSQVVPINDYIDCLNKESMNINNKILSKEDISHFKQNIKLSNSYIDDENFNAISYAIYYCKYDCLILGQGMDKFQNYLNQIYDKLNINKDLMSMDSYLSISGLAYKITRNYGCFDGCFELSKTPLLFMQKFINGGCCMTKQNIKHDIITNVKENEFMCDFDAVSLYPSAMLKFKGILKGTPKIIKNEEEFEKNKDEWSGFFIKCQIENINKHYDFPLLMSKEEGINKYDDKDTKNKIYYFDNYYYQDVKRAYPDIKINFIKGYYFNDGYNTKINELIQILFDYRNEMKKIKNPLQEIIKLIMNSIYGKSLLKANDEEVIFKRFDNNNDINKYIIRNMNHLKETNINNNNNMCKIIKNKDICDHFSLVHFGINILSYSKLLMNNLKILAYDNKLNIYYQDTDSIHITNKDLLKLEKLYKDTYNKALIGTKLGEFHNDFELNGTNENIYSTHSIILGKKAYVDELINIKTNETGYHIRLKGIPSQVIINYCDKKKINIIDLYKKLYNGESIIFDLNDGRINFKKDKNYNYSNNTNLNKIIKF